MAEPTNTPPPLPEPADDTQLQEYAGGRSLGSLSKFQTDPYYLKHDHEGRKNLTRQWATYTERYLESKGKFKDLPADQEKEARQKIHNFANNRANLIQGLKDMREGVYKQKDMNDYAAAVRRGGANWVQQMKVDGGMFYDGLNDLLPSDIMEESARAGTALTIMEKLGKPTEDELEVFKHAAYGGPFGMDVSYQKVKEHPVYKQAVLDDDDFYKGLVADQDADKFRREERAKILKGEGVTKTDLWQRSQDESWLKETDLNVDGAYTHLQKTISALEEFKENPAPFLKHAEQTFIPPGYPQDEQGKFLTPGYPEWKAKMLYAAQTRDLGGLTDEDYARMGLADVSKPLKVMKDYLVEKAFREDDNTYVPGSPAEASAKEAAKERAKKYTSKITEGSLEKYTSMLEKLAADSAKFDRVNRRLADIEKAPELEEFDKLESNFWDTRENRIRYFHENGISEEKLQKTYGKEAGTRRWHEMVSMTKQDRLRVMIEAAHFIDDLPSVVHQRLDPEVTSEFLAEAQLNALDRFEQWLDTEDGKEYRQQAVDMAVIEAYKNELPQNEALQRIIEKSTIEYVDEATGEIKRKSKGSGALAEAMYENADGLRMIPELLIEQLSQQWTTLLELGATGGGSAATRKIGSKIFSGGKNFAASKWRIANRLETLGNSQRAMAALQSGNRAKAAMALEGVSPSQKMAKAINDMRRAGYPEATINMAIKRAKGGALRDQAMKEAAKIADGMKWAAHMTVGINSYGQAGAQQFMDTMREAGIDLSDPTQIIDAFNAREPIPPEVLAAGDKAVEEHLKKYPKTQGTELLRKARYNYRVAGGSVAVFETIGASVSMHLMSTMARNARPVRSTRVQMTGAEKGVDKTVGVVNAPGAVKPVLTEAGVGGAAGGYGELARQSLMGENLSELDVFLETAVGAVMEVAQGGVGKYAGMTADQVYRQVALDKGQRKALAEEKKKAKADAKKDPKVVNRRDLEPEDKGPIEGPLVTDVFQADLTDEQRKALADKIETIRGEAGPDTSSARPQPETPTDEQTDEAAVESDATDDTSTGDMTSEEEEELEARAELDEEFANREAAAKEAAEESTAPEEPGTGEVFKGVTQEGVAPDPEAEAEEAPAPAESNGTDEQAANDEVLLNPPDMGPGYESDDVDDGVKDVARLWAAFESGKSEARRAHYRKMEAEGRAKKRDTTHFGLPVYEVTVIDAKGERRKFFRGSPEEIAQLDFLNEYEKHIEGNADAQAKLGDTIPEFLRQKQEVEREQEKVKDSQEKARLEEQARFDAEVDATKVRLVEERAKAEQIKDPKEREQAMKDVLREEERQAQKLINEDMLARDGAPTFDITGELAQDDPSVVSVRRNRVERERLRRAEAAAKREIDAAMEQAKAEVEAEAPAGQDTVELTPDDVATEELERPFPLTGEVEDPQEKVYGVTAANVPMVVTAASDENLAEVLAGLATQVNELMQNPGTTEEDLLKLGEQAKALVAREEDGVVVQDNPTILNKMKEIAGKMPNDLSPEARATVAAQAELLVPDEADKVGGIPITPGKNVLNTVPMHRLAKGMVLKVRDYQGQGLQDIPDGTSVTVLEDWTYRGVGKVPPLKVVFKRPIYLKQTEARNLDTVTRQLDPTAIGLIYDDGNTETLAQWRDALDAREGYAEGVEQAAETDAVEEYRKGLEALKERKDAVSNSGLPAKVQTARKKELDADFLRRWKLTAFDGQAEKIVAAHARQAKREEIQGTIPEKSAEQVKSENRVRDALNRIERARGLQNEDEVKASMKMIIDEFDKGLIGPKVVDTTLAKGELAPGRYDQDITSYRGILRTTAEGQLENLGDAVMGWSDHTTSIDPGDYRFRIDLERNRDFAEKLEREGWLENNKFIGVTEMRKEAKGYTKPRVAYDPPAEGVLPSLRSLIVSDEVGAITDKQLGFLLLAAERAYESKSDAQAILEFVQSNDVARAFLKKHKSAKPYVALGHAFQEARDAKFKNVKFLPPFSRRVMNLIRDLDRTTFNEMGHSVVEYYSGSPFNLVSPNNVSRAVAVIPELAGFTYHIYGNTKGGTAGNVPETMTVNKYHRKTITYWDKLERKNVDKEIIATYEDTATINGVGLPVRNEDGSNFNDKAEDLDLHYTMGRIQAAVHGLKDDIETDVTTHLADADFNPIIYGHAHELGIHGENGMRAVAPMHFGFLQREMIEELNIFIDAPNNMPVMYPVISRHGRKGLDASQVPYKDGWRVGGGFGRFLDNIIAEKNPQNTEVAAIRVSPDEQSFEKTERNYEMLANYLGEAGISFIVFSNGQRMDFHPPSRLTLNEDKVAEAAAKYKQERDTNYEFGDQTKDEFFDANAELGALAEGASEGPEPEAEAYPFDPSDITSESPDTVVESQPGEEANINVDVSPTSVEALQTAQLPDSGYTVNPGLTAEESALTGVPNAEMTPDQLFEHVQVFATKMAQGQFPTDQQPKLSEILSRLTTTVEHAFQSSEAAEVEMEQKVVLSDNQVHENPVNFSQKQWELINRVQDVTEESGLDLFPDLGFRVKRKGNKFTRSQVRDIQRKLKTIIKNADKLRGDLALHKNALKPLEKKLKELDNLWRDPQLDALIKETLTDAQIEELGLRDSLDVTPANLTALVRILETDVTNRKELTDLYYRLAAELEMVNGGDILPGGAASMSRRGFVKRAVGAAVGSAIPVTKLPAPAGWAVAEGQLPWIIRFSELRLDAIEASVEIGLDEYEQTEEIRWALKSSLKGALKGNMASLPVGVRGLVDGVVKKFSDIKQWSSVQDFVPGEGEHLAQSIKFVEHNSSYDINTWKGYLTRLDDPEWVDSMAGVVEEFGKIGLPSETLFTPVTKDGKFDKHQWVKTNKKYFKDKIAQEKKVIDRIKEELKNPDNSLFDAYRGLTLYSGYGQKDIVELGLNELDMASKKVSELLRHPTVPKGVAEKFDGYIKRYKVGIINEFLEYGNLSLKDVQGKWGLTEEDINTEEDTYEVSRDIYKETSEADALTELEDLRLRHLGRLLHELNLRVEKANEEHLHPSAAAKADNRVKVPLMIPFAAQMEGERFALNWIAMVNEMLDEQGSYAGPTLGEFIESPSRFRPALQMRYAKIGPEALATFQNAAIARYRMEVRKEANSRILKMMMDRVAAKPKEAYTKFYHPHFHDPNNLPAGWERGGYFLQNKKTSPSGEYAPGGTIRVFTSRAAATRATNAMGLTRNGPRGPVYINLDESKPLPSNPNIPVFSNPDPENGFDGHPLQRVKVPGKQEWMVVVPYNWKKPFGAAPKTTPRDQIYTENGVGYWKEHAFHGRYPATDYVQRHWKEANTVRPGSVNMLSKSISEELRDMMYTLYPLNPPPAGAEPQISESYSHEQHPGHTYFKHLKDGKLEVWFSNEPYEMAAALDKGETIYVDDSQLKTLNQAITVDDTGKVTSVEVMEKDGINGVALIRGAGDLAYIRQPSKRKMSENRKVDRSKPKIADDALMLEVRKKHAKFLAMPINSNLIPAENKVGLKGSDLRTPAFDTHANQVEQILTAAIASYTKLNDARTGGVELDVEMVRATALNQMRLDIARIRTGQKMLKMKRMLGNKADRAILSMMQDAKLLMRDDKSPMTSVQAREVMNKLLVYGAKGFPGIKLGKKPSLTNVKPQSAMYSSAAYWAFAIDKVKDFFSTRADVGTESLDVAVEGKDQGDVTGRTISREQLGNLRRIADEQWEKNVNQQFPGITTEKDNDAGGSPAAGAKGSAAYIGNLKPEWEALGIDLGNDENKRIVRGVVTDRFHGSSFKMEAVDLDKGQVLQAIANHANEDSYHGDLARLVLTRLDLVGRTRFLHTDHGDYSGMFVQGRKGEDLVILGSWDNGRPAIDTLLHEMLHRMTYAALENPSSASERAAVSSITQAYRRALQVFEDNGAQQDFDYYFDNIHEFIAGVFTDSHFQEFLNAIDVQPGIGRKMVTLLRTIVRHIASLLSNGRVRHGSALHVAMEETLGLIHNAGFRSSMLEEGTLHESGAEKARSNFEGFIPSQPDTEADLRRSENSTDIASVGDWLGIGKYPELNDWLALKPARFNILLESINEEDRDPIRGIRNRVPRISDIEMDANTIPGFAKTLKAVRKYHAGKYSKTTLMGTGKLLVDKEWQIKQAQQEAWEDVYLHGSRMKGSPLSDKEVRMALGDWQGFMYQLMLEGAFDKSNWVPIGAGSESLALKVKGEDRVIKIPEPGPARNRIGMSVKDGKIVHDTSSIPVHEVAARGRIPGFVPYDIESMMDDGAVLTSQKYLDGVEMKKATRNYEWLNRHGFKKLSNFRTGSKHFIAGLEVDLKGNFLNEALFVGDGFGNYYIALDLEGRNVMARDRSGLFGEDVPQVFDPILIPLPELMVYETNDELVKAREFYESKQLAGIVSDTPYPSDFRRSAAARQYMHIMAGVERAAVGSAQMVEAHADMVDILSGLAPDSIDLLLTAAVRGMSDPSTTEEEYIAWVNPEFVKARKAYRRAYNQAYVPKEVQRLAQIYRANSVIENDFRVPAKFDPDSSNELEFDVYVDLPGSITGKLPIETYKIKAEVVDPPPFDPEGVTEDEWADIVGLEMLMAADDYVPRPGDPPVLEKHIELDLSSIKESAFDKFRQAATKMLSWYAGKQVSEVRLKGGGKLGEKALSQIADKAGLNFSDGKIKNLHESSRKLLDAQFKEDIGFSPHVNDDGLLSWSDGSPVKFFRGSLDTTTNLPEENVFVTPHPATAGSYGMSAGTNLGKNLINKEAAGYKRYEERVLGFLKGLSVTEKRLAATQLVTGEDVDNIFEELNPTLLDLDTMTTEELEYRQKEGLRRAQRAFEAGADFVKLPWDDGGPIGPKIKGGRGRVRDSMSPFSQLSKFGSVVWGRVQELWEKADWDGIFDLATKELGIGGVARTAHDVSTKKHNMENVGTYAQWEDVLREQREIGVFHVRAGSAANVLVVPPNTRYTNRARLAEAGKKGYTIYIKNRAVGDHNHPEVVVMDPKDLIPVDSYGPYAQDKPHAFMEEPFREERRAGQVPSAAEQLISAHLRGSPVRQDFERVIREEDTKVYDNPFDPNVFAHPIAAAVSVATNAAKYRRSILDTARSYLVQYKDVIPRGYWDDLGGDNTPMRDIDIREEAAMVAPEIPVAENRYIKGVMAARGNTIIVNPDELRRDLDAIENPIYRREYVRRLLEHEVAHIGAKQIFTAKQIRGFARDLTASKRMEIMEKAQIDGDPNSLSDDSLYEIGQEALRDAWERTIYGNSTEEAFMEFSGQRKGVINMLRKFFRKLANWLGQRARMGNTSLGIAAAKLEEMMDALKRGYVLEDKHAHHPDMPLYARGNGLWFEDTNGHYKRGFIPGMKRMFRFHGNWTRELYERAIEPARGESNERNKRLDIWFRDFNKALNKEHKGWKNDAEFKQLLHTALGSSQSLITPQDQAKLNALKKYESDSIKRWVGQAHKLANQAKAKGATHDTMLTIYRNIEKGKRDRIKLAAKKFARRKREMKQAAREAHIEAQKLAHEKLGEKTSQQIKKVRRMIDTASESIALFQDDRGAGRRGQEIKNNIGIYLHRAYRSMTSPHYAKWLLKGFDKRGNIVDNDPGALLHKVEPLVKKRLRMIKTMEYLRTPGFTDATARAQAIRDVTPDMVTEELKNLVLVGHHGGGNGLRHTISTKLNSSILAEKNVIPDEIRELWGEYDDVGHAAMQTVEAVESYLTNLHMMERINRIGRKQGLISDEQKAGFERLYKSGDTQKYGPLADAYVHKFLYDVIRDTPQANDFLVTWGLRASGMALATKTVLSIPTAIRNFTSNILSALKNGHLWHLLRHPLRAFKEPGAASWGYLRNRMGADTRAEAERLLLEATKLGYIDSSEAVIADDMLRVSNKRTSKDDLQFNEGNIAQKTWQYGTKASALAAGGLYRQMVAFYGSMDNFWKINGFQVELARIMRRDNLDAPTKAAKQEAADIIKEIYANYTRNPAIIQSLKGTAAGLFLAPFITFTYQMWRTAQATIRLGIKEWKNGDKRTGARRIGMEVFAMTFMGKSIAALAQWLFSSLDDEDEERLRSIVPDYQKQNMLIPMGVKNGEVTYLDLSYFNQYDAIERVLQVALRTIGKKDHSTPDGKEAGVIDALAEGAIEMMTPYTKQQLLFSRIQQAIWAGKDQYGRALYTNQDTREFKLEQALKHIWGAYETGTEKRIMMAFNSARGTLPEHLTTTWQKEFWTTVGLKTSTVDLKKKLLSSAKRFSLGSSESKGMLNAVLRNPRAVNEATASAAYIRFWSNKRRAFVDLVDQIESARHFGLTEKEIYKALRGDPDKKGSGLSHDNVRDAMKGIYRKDPITKQDKNRMREAAGGVSGDAREKGLELGRKSVPDKEIILIGTTD